MIRLLICILRRFSRAFVQIAVAVLVPDLPGPTQSENTLPTIQTFRAASNSLSPNDRGRRPYLAIVLLGFNSVGDVTEMISDPAMQHTQTPGQGSHWRPSSTTVL